MILLRKGSERGHFAHGWLDTLHTFSFAEYWDPRHVAFRTLRVLNEDRIAPGAGFPTHPHRDMEILTVVLEGALEHRDSMGNGSIIRPGEVQRMTAGTGVTHSERNASGTEPLHLLQIWILPERSGLPPGYEQRAFPDREGRLCLVAARDGREGAVTIHQDVDLFSATLAAGALVQHALRLGRHVWIQVARGVVTAFGQRLEAGDGAAVSGEPSLTLSAQEAAEVLLFDLA